MTIIRLRVVFSENSILEIKLERLVHIVALFATITYPWPSKLKLYSWCQSRFSLRDQDILVGNMDKHQRPWNKPLGIYVFFSIQITKLTSRNWLSPSCVKFYMCHDRRWRDVYYIVLRANCNKQCSTLHAL